jgi:hypothetical protein
VSACVCGLHAGSNIQLWSVAAPAGTGTLLCAGYLCCTYNSKFWSRAMVHAMLSLQLVTDYQSTPMLKSLDNTDATGISDLPAGVANCRCPLVLCLPMSSR